MPCLIGASDQGYQFIVHKDRLLDVIELVYRLLIFKLRNWDYVLIYWRRYCVYVCARTCWTVLDWLTAHLHHWVIFFFNSTNLNRLLAFLLGQNTRNFNSWGTLLLNVRLTGIINDILWNEVVDIMCGNKCL